MSQTKAQLISDLVQALNFTGTASAPANGAFLSAANTLALATNSAQRLTIDSSGNVLIGTTSNNSERLRVQNNATTSTVCQLSIISGNAERSILNFGDADDHNIGRISYNNSDNSLFFHTDNTERMRITSTGNVGVGTASPTFSSFGSNTGGIEISDVGSSANALLVQSGSNEFFFANTSSANYIVGTDNAPLIISTNGSERMRIKSTGTVGIGTTNPTAKLDVKSTGDNIDEISLIHSGNTVKIASLGQISSHGSLALRTNSGTLTVRLSATTESSYINSGGNFGIGTSSPAALLHLKSSSADCDLQVESTGSATDARLNLYGRSNGVSQIRFGDENDTNVGLLTYDHTDNYMMFRTADAERMRIDSSGRVLIGTTSILHSQSNKLYVAGTDSSTSISLNRYADSIYAPYIHFRKSRSGTVGGNTIVQNNDLLGRIYFEGNDGSSPVSAAYIEGLVDGTPGNQDMPGRLVFLTAADGTPTPVERMRIASNGLVSVKTNGLNLENATATSSRAYSITNAGGTTGWTFGNGVLASAHQFVIYDNSAGAGRVLIDSNGIARFNNGIQLGNGLTSSSNHHLDDYEEGTFTPEFNSGSSSGACYESGVSYSSQIGAYRKIGNVVHFIIRLVVSSGTRKSGVLQINNLPFNSGNFGSFAVSGGAFISYTTLFSSTAHMPTIFQVCGSSQLQFYDTNGNNFAGTSLNSAAGRIDVHGHYLTS